MRNYNCRCQNQPRCRCQRANTNSCSLCSRNVSQTCPYMNSNNSSNTSNPFPSNYLYGHAYTPNQRMNELFDPQTGLSCGSMYPELVSPYSPGDSMAFIEYLKTTDRNGGCGCE